MERTGGGAPALGPWEVATRLEALLPLIEGEDDWTASAAWLALRALAEVDPDRRDEVERRARAKVPSPEQPLSPMARTLAVTGAALASSSEARIPYLRLRARVRRELAEG